MILEICISNWFANCVNLLQHHHIHYLTIHIHNKNIEIHHLNALYNASSLIIFYDIAINIIILYLLHEQFSCLYKHAYISILFISNNIIWSIHVFYYSVYHHCYKIYYYSINFIYTFSKTTRNHQMFPNILIQIIFTVKYFFAVFPALFFLLPAVDPG